MSRSRMSRRRRMRRSRGVVEGVSVVEEEKEEYE